MLKRRADGRFELNLDQIGRDNLATLLGQLDDLIADNPDHPNAARLRPPAYLHDPDADAAYQLLAGDELRTSQRAAIATVRDSLGRDRLTEDELWSWLRALNAVRLVVGTRLDISEDENSRPDPTLLSADDQFLWNVYDWTTLLQFEVVRALQS